MDIRTNTNLDTGMDSTVGSSSFSTADVGNLGALFILGYIVGSGRWRMLAGPGSSFISSLGNMAVNHALQSFKSQGLFSKTGGNLKGSSPYSSSQSPEDSTIKSARSAM